MPPGSPSNMSSHVRNYPAAQPHQAKTQQQAQPTLKHLAKSVHGEKSGLDKAACEMSEE